jgi:hypothetical protein
MPELDDCSAGDDLLRWCSEVGSGAWPALSEAAAYVARSRDVRKRPWQLAVELSRLGHIDIDWEGRQWSVAPPCVALSPGMGLCSYLAGWRPHALLAQYHTLKEDLGVFPFDVRQGSAPTAMFAKYQDVDRLEHIAAKLGLPVVLDPSAQLAELIEVPSLDALSLGAPPPLEESLARFDPTTMKWSPCEDRERDGLYEFELHGRREHRMRIDGDWRIVDRSTGQLLLMAGAVDVLHWHKPAPDMSAPSAFAVPATVGVPQLADRCLSSASGLLPVDHRGLRIYRNVAHDVAEIVATRLGFPLTVHKEPLPAPYGGTR